MVHAAPRHPSQLQYAQLPSRTCTSCYRCLCKPVEAGGGGGQGHRASAGAGAAAARAAGAAAANAGYPGRCQAAPTRLRLHVRLLEAARRPPPRSVASGRDAHGCQRLPGPAAAAQRPTCPRPLPSLTMVPVARPASERGRGGRRGRIWAPAAQASTQHGPAFPPPRRHCLCLACVSPHPPRPPTPSGVPCALQCRRPLWLLPRASWGLVRSPCGPAV